ncbi:MAG: TetR/AcrR family transcriptional regulator [Bacillota bacterium]
MRTSHIDPGPQGRETRARILRAAEEVFAERGFDGARVDEVARRAGVNKALLYYYFEGKEQILNDLVKTYIQETLETKEQMWSKLEPRSANQLDHIINMIAGVYEEKKNILRIILLELLKGTADSSRLGLLDPVFADAISRFRALGYTTGDQSSAMISVCFFALVPLLVFSLVREQWADYYNLDPADCSASFMRGFKRVFPHLVPKNDTE